MERLHDNLLAQLAAVAAGCCVVLFFEWHTDEPLVVLPVLLLASFVAGWAAPQRIVLAGLTIGLCILVAHALSSATGLMIPRYQKQPPSLGDWVTMALLILPSIAFAYAGSRVAVLAQQK